MLIERAGQVGLLAQPERVFDGKHHQFTGALADMRASGVRKAGRVIFGGASGLGRAGLANGFPQRRAIESTLAPCLCGIRQIAELLVPGDVIGGPPAGKRRQVMRACHGGGTWRPGAGRRELLLLIAFEPQHAHAVDTSVSQAVLKAFRNGPEILGQHDRTVAMRFQLYKAEQVRLRKRQVGALRTGGAIGNDPQPVQPHGVIDPHAACMGQCRLQHLAIRGVAARGQANGRKRGQPPVLAVALHEVRRRADSQAQQRFALPAPALAAAGIRADGKVADQAYAHARRAAGFLSPCKTAVGTKLQPGVKGDVLAVLRCKRRNCRGVRALERRRPGSPMPERLVLGEEMAVQRLEQRMRLQATALFAAECLQRRALVLVQSRYGEHPAQLGQTEFGRFRPVHQIFGRQSGTARVDAGMEHVQRRPAGRRVGAEPVGIGSELCVHRRDADCLGTVGSSGRRECCKGGEIAETGIARPAQRV